MTIKPAMMDKLKQSLIKHEGLKKFPYKDTVGKITIGIGYNLSDRGMTDEWINNQYQQDVSYFYSQLDEFPWFQKLNEDRQIVLIDMCFMGWKKFLGFKKMLDALSEEEPNYKSASYEILNSQWAEQVKNRAIDLANGMLTGNYSSYS